MSISTCYLAIEIVKHKIIELKKKKKKNKKNKKT